MRSSKYPIHPRKLAAQLGCCVRYVYRLFKAGRITITPDGTAVVTPAPPSRSIRTQTSTHAPLLHGLTICEIQRITGISRPTIYHAIREHRLHVGRDLRVTVTPAKRGRPRKERA